MRPLSNARPPPPGRGVRGGSSCGSELAKLSFFFTDSRHVTLSSIRRLQDIVDWHTGTTLAVVTLRKDSVAGTALAWFWV